MTDAALAPELAYYAANGAALFPMPAGSKAPTGIVSSFAHDWSRDTEQWARWRSSHAGCNFGVVAGPSRLIIVDIDVKAGRDEAWAAWCDLAASWGLSAVPMPHVATPSGGWHVYFRTDADPATLRQPDAIKKVINVRAGNGYTVAIGPGYTALCQDAPYPAPDALVQHCTRATSRPAASKPTGTRDVGDVAALVRWLHERDAFNDYESWFQLGMALRIEFGDAGYDLWLLATWPDAIDIAAAKWESFASDPTADSVTLASFLQRAHAMGWTGSVRKSTSAMFDTVAAIAAAANASLPAGSGAMPMVAGQAVLTDLGTPIVEDFLAATVDAPTRPAALDYPNLPDSVAGHGLYQPLVDAVSRIVAMAEQPKTFRATRVTDVLAVLSIVHKDTFEAVCRRIRNAGCHLPPRTIKLAAASLAEQVERAFVANDDWIYDAKGVIESNNSDNVAVFLGVLGCDLRWNAWLERAEIKGWEWPDWTYVDDTIKAKLLTRANRTKTRFLPAENFFWNSLLALAHERPVDPAMERLATLEAAWDGTPRLSIWLSQTAGVPCDPYHQAVAKNIVGGMVRRIRNPGCKHDLMPIFYGHQGTGKSTMAAVIADMGQSSLASIIKGGGAWFSDDVLLGDASKELVLALAGKTVVEIGEMGARQSASPNHVKAMLSRQVDRGRTAYARSVTERPRRNVIIGTTNDDEPLIDTTGNRRFLPVKIEQELDLEWLSQHIVQIIGEAASLHSQGADFALPRSVWGDAAERQEAARSVSDIETMLNEWFAPSAHTGNVNYILASDLIWLADMSGWKSGGATAMRAAVMKRLRFRSENIMHLGKRTRAWVRGSKDVRPVDVSRIGVRYMVAPGQDGRPPRVEIRSTGMGAGN